MRCLPDLLSVEIVHKNGSKNVGRSTFILSFLSPLSETPISHLTGLLAPYACRLNHPAQLGLKSHKPCAVGLNYPWSLLRIAFTDIFTINSPPILVVVRMALITPKVSSEPGDECSEI